MSVFNTPRIEPFVFIEVPPGGDGTAEMFNEKMYGETMYFEGTDAYYQDPTTTLKASGIWADGGKE